MIFFHSHVWFIGLASASNGCYIIGYLKVWIFENWSCLKLNKIIQLNTFLVYSLDDLPEIFFWLENTAHYFGLNGYMFFSLTHCLLSPTLWLLSLTEPHDYSSFFFNQLLYFCHCMLFDSLWPFSNVKIRSSCARFFAVRQFSFLQISNLGSHTYFR